MGAVTVNPAQVLPQDSPQVASAARRLIGRDLPPHEPAEPPQLSDRQGEERLASQLLRGL